MTTKSFSAAVVRTIMLVLGSSTGMMGADWPSFRGPSHDGKSTEAITWPKDKELGSAHVIEGRAFTAPVFANGKAFARNTKGDVVCLDFSGR